MRSPAIQNIQRNVQQKSYKHVEFIELVSLRTIVDIKDDGNGKVFSLDVSPFIFLFS